MAEIVTDVLIEAPAQAVWEILTDGSRYAAWNPVIRSVSGTIDLHGTLTVQRVTPGGGEHTTHPTVAFFSSDREMRWRERTVLPGILDTEESFKLERQGPDRVRFVHWLATSGVLTALGSGSADQERQMLEAMNLALKAHAEHTQTGAADGAAVATPRASRPGHSTTA